MPWTETSPLSERLSFIADHQRGLFTMSELCDHYGISRKTGYKWLHRYQKEGELGLEDRSRAPRSRPHKLSEEVTSAILWARERHSTWGPKKLLAWLRVRCPDLELPAVSTAGDLLAREGMVKVRPPRSRRAPGAGRDLSRAEKPNEVWTADFKGQFLTGDSRYCYPLTVADEGSRYLFACRALEGTRTEPVARVFERLFRTYGLPEVICTDNGSPFAGTGLQGLSRLNVWWLRLGIRHVRIARGHPEENGVHERMHRTLKAETARPPRSNLRTQQRAFDSFRKEFNQERPHEALGLCVPASIYEPSRRPLPSRVPLPEYPGHFEVRKVGGDGSFHWHQDAIFVSRSLHKEHVGLEEVDDGIWAVYFCNVLMGRFDERNKVIYPTSEEKQRRAPSGI